VREVGGAVLHLLVLAMVLATPAAAQAVPATAQAMPAPESAPAIAGPAVEARQMSAADVLGLAARWIEEGRLDEADTLLGGLERNRDGGSQRQFLQGTIRFLKQDYKAAAARFRAILRDEPAATRVRLELARSLFLLGDDAAADYHFRLAVADNPQREVLANVAAFRQQIRERRRWSASLEFGAAPDTNINQATSDRTLDNANLPGRPDKVVLSDDARRTSGVGISVEGQAQVRLVRFGNNAIVANGFAIINEYKGGTFDDYLLGAELGPQMTRRWGRLTVSGSGYRRWYGHEPYLNALGVRVRLERPVSNNWQWDYVAQWQRLDYRRNAGLDGQYFSVGAALSRALSARSFGQLRGFVSRQSARDPGFAFVDARSGLSYARELPWGLVANADLDLTRTWYDAPSFFGPTRREWRVRAALALTKRDWQWLGFSPTVRFIHTSNISNLDFFTYHRERGEFAITRPF